MLLKKPDLLSFIKFTGFSALSGLITHRLMNPREKTIVNEKNVLIATGCDSGLGYSIAIHCHEKLNLSVIAVVQQLKSPGAVNLKRMFENSKRFHMIELEITRDDSIESMRKFVEDFFDKNEDLELTALLNNCGVMIFGESEWQTSKHIEKQISVNLTGTIKLTHSMLPLIRRHKSRIINVTSHCSKQPLPSLSIYAATKAGLASFTEGLRLEMKPYDVDVVNFMPGSFWKSSNLMASQSKHSQEMLAAFSDEQRKFYGAYFNRFNKYVASFGGEKSPSADLDDANILRTFEDALLDDPPKRVYVCEPWRYKIYHLLFKITPLTISDWLVKRFANMPQYKAIEN